MGDVWVARNEATQAELAVKTLQRSERSPTHDERFRREARLSATISHRNVVRVFDLIDEEDGTLGLVMELLRGGTLQECMKERGVLTTAQALAVTLPILSAMDHVHHKGIIHRDMKPANVFLSVEPDGHVIPKILDFGIAKVPTATSALTIDGSVLGTPHYMSPEQIRGQEDLDGRSDMFSLAVVLHEMLTGTRAFQRETAAASLAAVLEHEIDPDSRIEPKLWLVVSRALAKRPYERYPTCAELADALRRASELTDEDLSLALQDLRPQSLAHASSTSPSSIAISKTNRPKAVERSNPLRTVAIAGSAAALAIGLTLIATSSSPKAQGTEPAPPSTTALVNSAEIPPAVRVDPPPTSATPPPMTSTPSTATPPAPAPKPLGTPKRPPKTKPTGVATTPGF